MSIQLAAKYGPYVDELFKAESKVSLLTNNDYDWTGAKTIKLYKISTAALNDYARNVASNAESFPISRFGNLADLSATTEDLTLSNDKSFIFNIDKLDKDETGQALESGTALAREVREVVIPTVDTYIYAKLATEAYTKPTAKALTANNIYDEITQGSCTLDDYEVPEADRVIIVTPTIYKLLKQSDCFDHSDIGTDLRMKGVVGYIDGMAVVKVPTVRLPQNFGFLITHPSCCVAPVKLADYHVHSDTPLSSGDIVTGRICYDAFVPDNKTKGVYYQATTANNA